MSERRCEVCSDYSCESVCDDCRQWGHAPIAGGQGRTACEIRETGTACIILGVGGLILAIICFCMVLCGGAS